MQALCEMPKSQKGLYVGSQQGGKSDGPCGKQGTVPVARFPPVVRETQRCGTGPLRERMEGVMDALTSTTVFLAGMFLYPITVSSPSQPMWRRPSTMFRREAL